MNITYDVNLTPTARSWVETAVRMLSYPTERLNMDVHFVAADEPPCAGHQDYMCTQENFEVDGNGNTTSATATVTIRRGVEDPTHPMNAGLPTPATDTRSFFIESVMHELGHAVSFYWINSDAKRSQAAALFTLRGGTGEGMRSGTLADWNPMDRSSEVRVQEAIAEVFKDAYLSENERVFDNRTNWAISETNFGTLMRMLLPPVDIAGDPGASFVRRSPQLQTISNIDFSNSRWNDRAWRTANLVDISGVQWPASSVNQDATFIRGAQPKPFNGWVAPLYWSGPIYLGDGPAREKIGGSVFWQADFTPNPDWSKAFKFNASGEKISDFMDANYFGMGGPFATNPNASRPIQMRAQYLVPESAGNVGLLLGPEYEQVVGGIAGGGQIKVPPDLTKLGYSQDYPLELRVELEIGVEMVYYGWEDTPSWDYADVARMAGHDGYLGIVVAPGGPGVVLNMAEREWTVWTPDRPGSDPQHQDWDIPDYPYADPTINASTGPVGVFRYVTLRR